MKTNKIRMTEADLHNLIKESVMRVLNENEEDEGFMDSLRSVGKGLKAGWNGYKTSELTNNDTFQPNKHDAHGTLNFMDELLRQEQKLQQELNQVRAKRKQLEKQYGVSKGKGLNTSYNSMKIGASGGNRFASARNNARNAATSSNQSFLNTAH